MKHVIAMKYSRNTVVWKALRILLFLIIFMYLYRILTPAAVGYGIEQVHDDEIWMGWTYYESGNAGYGQAGGDGGKAYGRYQFDYRYALKDFLVYAYQSNPEKYSMLQKYLAYEKGSSELLYQNGLGSDWVRAYMTDKEDFSELQDRFSYETYYLPAKQSMEIHGIFVDDPVVKGSIYSFAIRDGANDSGVRAAWQSYRLGKDLRTWLIDMYALETSRHPSQSSRWDGGQKLAALNGGMTTAILSDAGTLLNANGAVYTDYVSSWIRKYPTLAASFIQSGRWGQENQEWASALRNAGDFYDLYGIRGGNLDFASGTTGGIAINDLVIHAENLTIPDNGSSLPIVYMAQSGGQPWSSIAFGGGTIATSGCSVTSLAMVLSYLKGGVGDSEHWVYPNQVVAEIEKKYGNYNYFYVGSGQSWDIFPAVASIYQVQCHTISSSSILNALISGQPVIMSCKPGEFTSTGHFIVLTGVTDDGYITVNDPNSSHSSYSYKKYPLSFIQSQGKGWWSFG